MRFLIFIFPLFALALPQPAEAVVCCRFATPSGYECAAYPSSREANPACAGQVGIGGVTTFMIFCGECIQVDGCPGYTGQNPAPAEPFGGCQEAATVTQTQPVVGFGNPLCPNPETPCNAPAIIGRLIKAVLGIVGAIALVMFIWGGFLWMMAGSGGEKKVQLAKDVLIWSTLGLLIIFSSYLMVNFVIERLQP